MTYRAKLVVFSIAVSVSFTSIACSSGSSEDSSSSSDELLTIESLGKALFSDTNLSLNRAQSCATCHDPDHGFADPRDNVVSGAASLGDDDVSVGKRNAPTAAYAMLIPPFQVNSEGEFIGGQFHDGRVDDLAAQAALPPLGADEMGLADEATVIARIMENSTYVDAFKSLFGETIFDEVDSAYSAMSEAIAAFETTDEFAPFDSKYDRFLKGEYQMTAQEELGRLLFFSTDSTNCSNCHQLQDSVGAENETFSNYEFHNTGSPRNDSLLAANGDLVDKGLAENLAANSSSNVGKIKVPTLRNVAVTGPYMHNGVFQDLRTVVLFYDKFNNPSRSINPETGTSWKEAEYPDTVGLNELQNAPALTDEEVDALVSFLKTLTDQRYESILE